METRIIHEYRQIKLIVDDPKKPKDESDVLAAMILHEGTGCWRLYDVRLEEFGEPDPYSCSGVASDLCASFKPESKEESDYVKLRLREFREDTDGTILWCTFDGIVRGTLDVKGFKPALYKNFDQAGFFSKTDGLTLLREIQLFWSNIPDLNAHWRIENSHRQPNEARIASEIMLQRTGIVTKEDLLKRLGITNTIDGEVEEIEC